MEAHMTINDRKPASANDRLPMLLAIAVVSFALLCATLLALLSDLSLRA